MRLAVALVAASACAPGLSTPRIDPCADVTRAAHVLDERVGRTALLYTQRPKRAGGYTYRGRRTAAVNRGYLTTVRAAFGEGAAEGVCAHEYGHHEAIRGAFAAPDSEVEEYADAFAGCVLAMLGLPIDGYAELVEHEAGSKRSTAARQGWHRCDEEIPR